MNRLPDEIKAVITSDSDRYKRMDSRMHRDCKTCRFRKNDAFVPPAPKLYDHEFDLPATARFAADDGRSFKAEYQHDPTGART